MNRPLAHPVRVKERNPEEDRIALLSSLQPAQSHVLQMRKGDIISVADAAELANVSDETIRRWCAKYGIGRKYRTHAWADWKWQVSRPGLRIVMARDWDALELLMRDERDHPDLAEYLSP